MASNPPDSVQRVSTAQFYPSFYLSSIPNLYATHISSTAALRLITVTLHRLPPPKLPNSLHRLHRPRALAVDEMRDPVLGQPPGLGHDEERDEREDRDDAHDDRGICPLALA